MRCRQPSAGLLPGIPAAHSTGALSRRVKNCKVAADTQPVMTGAEVRSANCCYGCGWSHPVRLPPGEQCLLTGVWECRYGLSEFSAHAQHSHSSPSGTSSTQPGHSSFCHDSIPSSLAGHEFRMQDAHCKKPARSVHVETCRGSHARTVTSAEGVKGCWAGVTAQQLATLPTAAANLLVAVRGHHILSSCTAASHGLSKLSAAALPA